MDKTIAAFGEVMMRLEVPEYKKLHQENTLKYLFSGTGVNVLSGLSQFGYKTKLVSKLPANSIGDAALAQLRSLGINTDFVIRGGEYIGMYFLEKGFGIRPSQVTYTNRKESVFALSSTLEYEYDTFLEDTDVIHFCGISLALTENSRETVVKLATEAKNRGIQVCFDCNYRPKLGESYEQAKPWYEMMLQLADICFMSEKDAMYILGMKTTETTRERQIEDLLPKVAKVYNIHVMAGTIRKEEHIGERKLKGYIVANGEVTYSGEHGFLVYERIGSGDAFATGVLHGVLSCMKRQEIVNFATAASVYAHTTYGDSPIAQIAEIQKIVKGVSSVIER